MYAQAHIRSATRILEGYKGDTPFHLYLKEYFRNEKKFGSRDRKQIGHLCYCFFRSGFSLQHFPMEERIVKALFLCSTESNALLGQLDPGLNEKAGEELKDKMEWLDENGGFELQKTFTYYDLVSKELDKDAFLQSFYIQPDLFLRLRPGREESVRSKLTTAGIKFRTISESCLALPNSTRVEELIRLDDEAVVQDLSSQRTLDAVFEVLKGEWVKAWDCCSASGGKSLLLYDHYPEVNLTVSDIRSGIMGNLHKRFETAGIRDYESLVFDVSQKPLQNLFDLVICDAPCSGSGTWGRTPEQLHFFPKQKIEHYAGLQKRIAANAAWSVKHGGYFQYITCSVFEQENEAVVHFIEKETELKLVSSQYHKGYQQKADTLFSALFTAL